MVEVEGWDYIIFKLLKKEGDSLCNPYATANGDKLKEKLWGTKKGEEIEIAIGFKNLGDWIRMRLKRVGKLGRDGEYVIFRDELEHFTMGPEGGEVRKIILEYYINGELICRRYVGSYAV